MMRPRNFIPALALGLALSAPVAVSAQTISLPSLHFAEEGTFCGLFTLCTFTEVARDVQDPNTLRLLTAAKPAKSADAGAVTAKQHISKENQ